MKELYSKFLATVDADKLYEHTVNLWRKETGQTFADYKNAARYVYETLRSEGIPNAELLSFPADGKTVYQDKRMPLAWSATTGKLTLLGQPDGTEFVAADYRKHPFHLVKGSTATPADGIVTRIITESQYLAGEDPRGAMLMLEPFTWPRAKVLVPFLDQGGVGIITDFIKGRYDSPDSLTWVTAATEGTNWHVQCEDRPFIAFSVTPKVGDRIRDAATKGHLKARVESDGHRYEGELLAVTALIPGKRKEEVWLTGHLYEPLINDNSTGVMCAVEVARQIMMHGTPEFSVRLVFAMEYYGFAAYAASRGTYLGGKVIGGCNFDAMKPRKNAKILCFRGGNASPFYGNYIFEMLVAAMDSEAEGLNCQMDSSSGYQDDSFLSDPTIGVPTIWPIGRCDDGFWHNSSQDASYVDIDILRKLAAFYSGLIYAVANPKESYLDHALMIAKSYLQKTFDAIQKKPYGSDMERLTHIKDVEASHLSSFGRAFISREKIDSALAELEKTYAELSSGLTDVKPVGLWRNYAEGIISARLEQGFPQDLVKIPKSKRRELPDGMIYSSFANVYANIDGKKDLARLIREAEYETFPRTDKTIRQYVNAINYLADYGYLKLLKRSEIKQEEIVQALRDLGIRNGDALLVHSGKSPCGYIHGGTKSIVSAIYDAVGEKGTALFPTFTLSFFNLGSSLNRDYSYRPYDSSDFSQIWTGTVPREFLELHTEAHRSRHVTHSWSGLGSLAEECTRHHGESDPPCSLESPLGKMLEHDGKILYFGSGFNTSTFLHFLETQANVGYLDSAVCRVKNSDGTFKTLLIEKHLPGHRDFYRKDAENSKFFRAASSAGLEIRSVPLGIGKLSVISIRRLYEIGMNLLRKDPRIMLCDDPECLFCRKY